MGDLANLLIPILKDVATIKNKYNDDKYNHMLFLQRLKTAITSVFYVSTSNFSVEQRADIEHFIIEIDAKIQELLDWIVDCGENQFNFEPSKIQNIDPSFGFN